MRWVICAAVVLGFAQPVLAADFDILRGSESVGPAAFTNWSGVYVGGQASYSDVNADFSKASTPLVAQSLIETVLEADDTPALWPVLGKGNTDAFGYGGFVGYNSQWQNLILGLEGNYTHSPATVISTDSPILNRVVTAGALGYSVNLLGTGSLTVDDYVSLRARAGYILNNFLPYAFIGFVVGDGDYSLTTQVYGQQSSATPAVLPCAPSATCVNYNFTNSSVKNGALLYGFSFGGGVDVAITQQLFLRGEVELMQFLPVNDIVVSTLTARGGVGVKF